MRNVISLICFVFFFYLNIFVFADDKESDIKFDGSVGVGWEFLKYSEDEDDTNTKARSSMTNNIVKIDAWLEVRKFVINASAKLNVSSRTGDEIWKQDDVQVQENDLEYEWNRYDLGIGYVIDPIFKPVVGVRFSDVDQTRKDFVPAGMITKSVEEVDSKFAYIGFRSKVVLDRKVDLDFDFKYLEPFDVEVTNTAIPGLKIDDHNGWAIEGELSACYEFSPSWQIEYWAFGGITHWDGSDWEVVPGVGLVKWPENETEYWGIGLAISFKK